MLDFKDTIKNLPQQPGVYRYYSVDNSVLYIGKAKNLKNRVSSYFQEGRPHNQRLSLMISQIDRIEYTVVSSEADSLILEANLIHNLQPKYNILLKDDKDYLYVRITNDPIPAIFLVRRKYDPKSQYFGPYTKRSGIFETLRTLRTIFPYCQERFPQKKACNYVGIKQCDGICIGLETKEDYQAKINQIANVLSGQTEKVEEFLKDKIQQAATIGNYALAGLWRDRFKALKETVNDQKIVLPQPQDIDLITLIVQIGSDGLQIGSAFVQNIRQGKIVNVSNFLLSGTEGDDLEEESTAINADKTMIEELLDQNETEFSFLQRFISSYFAYKSDLVPIITQIYRQTEDN